MLCVTQVELLNVHENGLWQCLLTVFPEVLSMHSIAQSKLSKTKRKAPNRKLFELKTFKVELCN